MNRKARRISLVVFAPLWMIAVMVLFLSFAKDFSQTLLATTAVPAIAVALLPLFLAWQYREGASASVGFLSKSVLVVVGVIVAGLALLMALLVFVMIRYPGA